MVSKGIDKIVAAILDKHGHPRALTYCMNELNLSFDESVRIVGSFMVSKTG